MTANLDPIVAEAMKQTLNQINAQQMHPNDSELWMCLFPALVSAGYTYDADDIYLWVEQHWPGPLDPDDRRRRAVQISAWARMALSQSDRSKDWTKSAERIVSSAVRSCAARKAWKTRREAEGSTAATKPEGELSLSAADGELF